MELQKFDKYKESNIGYGGNSGLKIGIIIDSERWLIKLPKPTKNMTNVKITYTTSPLSEYIGSHIYELIGIDTHKTILGTYCGLLVVACKDFLKQNERLEDYTTIKNYGNKKILSKLLDLSCIHNSTYTDIDTLKELMSILPIFKNNQGLIDRFWDMFVVDALIGNNDRNNGNWGIIKNVETKETRIPPVYDNGASFYNKHDDAKMQDLLANEPKFINSVYDNAISSFAKEEKNINPLKYIDSMNDNDCNQAIIRIVPKINIDKIEKLLDSIPEYYEGIEILSNTRKEFYKKVIIYRYENILMPIYKKLKESI